MLIKVINIEEYRTKFFKKCKFSEYTPIITIKVTTRSELLANANIYDLVAKRFKDKPFNLYSMDLEGTYGNNIELIKKSLGLETYDVFYSDRRIKALQDTLSRPDSFFAQEKLKRDELEGQLAVSLERFKTDEFEKDEVIVLLGEFIRPNTDKVTEIFRINGDICGFQLGQSSGGIKFDLAESDRAATAAAAGDGGGDAVVKPREASVGGGVQKEEEKFVRVDAL